MLIAKGQDTIPAQPPTICLSHQNYSINNVDNAVICFDVGRNYRCVFDLKSVGAVNVNWRPFNGFNGA